MTDLLKTLLHNYGMLHVTIFQLEKERPGNPHESLNAYYETLGAPYETTFGALGETLGALDPGEPALVVRISPDGATRFTSADNSAIRCTAATPG